jgi:uncharacterized membrane protein YgaE (UPF0421/DUF939 family)
LSLLGVPKFTPALQLGIRGAVAAALAVAVAQRLNLAYPVATLIGSVIVTDLDPARTRQLGLRRLIGTLAAATIGMVVGLLLPPGPVAIGLGVMIAMIGAHLVGLDASVKLAGYVAGVVILAPGGAGPVWSALQRIEETVIGIAMAVLVSFVPKLLRLEK